MARREGVVFSSDRTLMIRLARSYPCDRPGYFYEGACGELRSVRLSKRAGMPRLVRVTTRFASLVACERMTGFTDRFAGWRGVPKTKRFSRVEIPVETLGAFAKKHLFFRGSTAYRDNYYFTDASLEWFAVFCHEDDWHLFSRRRDALSRLSLR